MNLSLTSGLIPITLQILALAAIVVAIGRGRSREWLRRWLLVAVLAGVGLAAAGRLIVRDQGLVSRRHRVRNGLLDCHARVYCNSLDRRVARV